MRALDFRTRITLLLIVSLAAAAAVAMHAPIPQATAYHGFADQRTMLGVPNFLNVASNLPFLVIGMAGIWTLARRKPTGVVAALRPVYYWVFGGIALVAFGSAYYQLAPSTPALTWDRLPMTVAFMASFALAIGEHIDPRLGLRLLAPLLLLGVGSVLYWHVTQSAGHGDLRPYLMVQFLPLLLVPLILLLFPSRLTCVGYLWALICSYALAKLLEAADAMIYAYGHLLSGHTLKHLIAGFGMYLLLLAIKRRVAIPAANGAKSISQATGLKAQSPGGAR
jgi:hypothetical protein